MSCAYYSTSTPYNLVENGYDKWGGFADRTLTEAINAAKDAQELDFSPLSLAVDFTVDVDPPYAFNTPTKPDASELDIDWGEAPTKPFLTPVSTVGFGSAPNLDAEKPTFSYPTPVTKPNLTDPGAAPTLSDVTIPDEPDLSLPAVPTLADINLPAAPNITIPTFNEVAPAADTIIAPDAEFTYTDTEFTDALLDQLKAKVSEWLNGGTGLPDYIWDMLWIQARNREAASATGARAEALNDWASRGFSLPGGVLDAKLQAINEKQWEAENTLAREIATQQAKMEVDNLRHAMTQGIALVQMLAQLHDQTMQRAFAVAQYTLEAKIKIFDAKVGFYNAQLQAYQVKAAVFKTRLEAALAHLEVYKAELEGQKLIGEINLQHVEVYKAQLQGVLAAVEIYKGQIQAVQAQVEVDTARIEAYRAKVGAYSERIQAYVAEVEAYAKRIEAEGVKANIYEAEVRAFLGQTQAYSAEVDAIAKQRNIAFQNNQLLLEQYKAETAGWATRIQQEGERIKSVLGIYAADAEIFKAEGQLEQARVQTDIARYQAAIARGTAEAEIELKQGQIDIEQAQRINALEVEVSKTLIGAYSQLAAASMSAVNLGASISAGHSWSNSSTCNMDY